jgi:type IX secretion system PorP/SprF family membrane protein
LTLTAVLAAIPTLTAQIDAGFSQYYEVPSYYNAASLGNTDYIRIRGGSRLQWMGITNAPKTFLGVADMPVKLGTKRIGVGLVMSQESMGLYSSLNLKAQGAYKFKLFGGTMALGFEVGFVDESFKGSQVVIPDDDDYHQSTDEGIPSQDIHGTAFDVGAGAWYVHKYFWAGVSATHLNSPTVKMSTDGTNAQEYEFHAGRTVYFMAGSNIPVKNTLFEIQPSMFVKTDFTFTSWELTARLRYNKFLTAGLGYRNGDAVIAVLGAEYRDFYLAYSYDYSISDIAQAANGSHEFWIGYRIKLNMGDKNRNRQKSIRIM